VIKHYANATALEIGRFSITSWPAGRACRLSAEVFRVDDVLHLDFGWAHPRRHARWARAITIQYLRKDRYAKRPYRGRYWRW
jgi:hypothetical protein